MKIKVIDHTQIDISAWQSYVNCHEYGNFFHTKEVFELWKGIPGFKPFALFAVNDNGIILAMLNGYYQSVKKGLAAFISTRAVIWQSPLYDDTTALEALLAKYNQISKSNAVYTEIRNNLDDEAVKKVYLNAGFEYREHLNYLVECTDYDITWKAVSEARRRQIKKGLASGAVIQSNPTLDQVKEFYSILTELYKSKVKKPLPPWEFFQNFYELTQQDASKGKYLLIEYNNKIIGGIMAPITRDLLIHELYVAGLDTQFKDQYPSILATWAAINYAIEDGVAFFDFMGAGKPEDSYGVREFKARFGGELVNYGRYYCVHSPWKMRIAEAGFKLIQRITG